MYGIVSKATFLLTNNASKNKIIAVINVNNVTPNPAKIFLNVKNNNYPPPSHTCENAAQLVS